MSYYSYFNGGFIPVDTPVLASNDLSLLRGYGLFDYFRTYNGKVFRWDDYWQRFERSAALLKLRLPQSKDETAAILIKLHEMSGEADVSFRLMLTGGYAADSVTVSAPNFLIRTEPVPHPPADFRVKGIKAIPYPYVRDLPEAKITSYIHLILMADELEKQDAQDLLFHHNGTVSEFTRSNLFIIKGKTLITPDLNILHGVTRKVILELAKPHYHIEIRPVSLSEMEEADEVFTTSSNKQVMPVRQVGEKTIGRGIYPETAFIQSLFTTYITNWGK